MITAQEVNHATFDKGMRGYRMEEVDQMLDRVAAQLDDDTAQITALQSENSELKQQLYLLAQKIEEYRADEDNLKSALINAQRMGESVIHEAKQKADVILREAGIRAEDITRRAREENTEEQIELERIRAEVGQFKSNVLSLYRQHIESLSTLPSAKEEDEEEPEVSLEEDFAQNEAFATPVLEDEAPEDEIDEELENEEPEDEEEIEEELEDEETFDAVTPVAKAKASSADFWEKDESELKAVQSPADEGETVLEAFKGIKFSD